MEYVLFTADYNKIESNYFLSSCSKIKLETINNKQISNYFNKNHKKDKIFIGELVKNKVNLLNLKQIIK